MDAAQFITHLAWHGFAQSSCHALRTSWQQPMHTCNALRTLFSASTTLLVFTAASALPNMSMLFCSSASSSIA